MKDVFLYRTKQKNLLLFSLIFGGIQCVFISLEVFFYIVIVIYFFGVGCCFSDIILNYLLKSFIYIYDKLMLYRNNNKN